MRDMGTAHQIDRLDVDKMVFRKKIWEAEKGVLKHHYVGVRYLGY